MLSTELVIYATSTKKDGNMSYLTGDPVIEETYQRRRIFLQKHNLALENLICLNQVHGTQVVAVTDADRGKGALTPDDALRETDALVTQSPGVILGVLTADCPPIFIVDPTTKAIGIVHAGWRGIAGGIIENTLEIMQKSYGSKPQDTHIHTGPSIRRCCYEIKDDVIKIFRDKYSPAEQQDMLVSDKGKTFLDLQEAIRITCVRSGIRPTSITDASICTKDNHAHHYSLRGRKSKSDEGLMLSFITLA